MNRFIAGTTLISIQIGCIVAAIHTSQYLFGGIRDWFVFIMSIAYGLATGFAITCVIREVYRGEK